MKEDKNKSKEEEQDITERLKKHKAGSFAGMIELTKELYKNRPKIEKDKELSKKDKVAIILTIVIVITICIILWFIPFTNGWIRDIFNNPLFNWIGSLFQK